MKDSNESVTIITMENFRGIKGPLSIEVPKVGRSGSALLVFGDNGSGKSTICDALEFATRGVVSRRSEDGAKRKREVRNLSTNQSPTVDIEFSEGIRYRRGFKRPSWAHANESVSKLNGVQDYVDGFAVCPITIRRDAVESFWRIDREKRFEFFWDYLKTPNEDYRSIKDENIIFDYANKKTDLKKARQRIDGLFPKKYRVDNFMHPTHSKNAQRALSEMAAKVNRKRYGRKNLNAEEKLAISTYVNCLRDEELLRSRAETSLKKVKRDTTELREMMAKVSPSISDDYRQITGDEWVEGIFFEIGENDELGVYLKRDGASSLRPEDVLSEAGLDLLALLILVELHIACAEKGQSKVIALDDVFQSVDTTLRGRALDHLAKRLGNWQVVLTLHDRLWLEIAKREFNSHKFITESIELRSGGYGGTPRVFSKSTGPLRDLEGAMESSSSVTIAAVAGRAFEALTDRLSVALRVEVKRREDDKYEINDTWPNVSKILDSFKDSEVSDLASQMSKTQFLRNRIGSHHATWGDGLSDKEAEESAQNVMKLWNKFLCPKCSGFCKFSKSGQEFIIVFKCCN